MPAKMVRALRRNPKLKNHRHHNGPLKFKSRFEHLTRLKKEASLNGWKNE